MNPDVLYHFTNKTIRDGKAIPPIGKWIEMTEEPIPCERGFHASPTPFDALQYAPGNLLHQVELGGKIIAHGTPVDKYAGQKRRILATIDAEPLMRSFARRCALDVIHLWDAPAIVREYLETADETKRDAAWAAADAAWAAARAAADAARAAADAAWADAAAWAARAAAWAARAAAWAARAAAWAAADAAWAARDAAWAAADAAWAAADAAWADADAADAAWAAARAKYRGWFNEMIETEFAGVTK